ncbi:MAG: SRPBCC family protein [Myxococcota bacterium]
MWPALLVWVVPSPAAEPTVSTDDAGVVRATAIVSAPVADALALVRDPDAVHRLSGDGATLTATPDGGCYRLAYALDTAIADVAYTARACPTADGFRSDLTESEAFRSMASEWTVRAVPGGTELTYVYRADVALPLPRFVIRRSTERAITEMMARVVARLDGGH